MRDLFVHPGMQSMPLQEAPGLAQVFAVGELGGLPCLVMDILYKLRQESTIQFSSPLLFISLGHVCPGGQEVQGAGWVAAAEAEQ